MGKASVKIHVTKCPWCGQEPPHYVFLKKTGDHQGNGGTLGSNILCKFYNGKGKKTAKDHPLSWGMPPLPGKKRPKKYAIAQAHHLICSQSMKKGWAKICATYGYDINHHKNGIFFPGDMRIACSLEIPLHKGEHYYTEPNYVLLVKDLIKGVKQKIVNKKACDKPGEIVKQLNNISADLCDGILEFTYKITSDGGDYKPKCGIGCANVTSIQDKEKKPGQFVFYNLSDCELERKHKILLRRSVHYFKPGELK